MKYTLYLFFILISLTGCFNPPDFPVVPEIEFKGFEQSPSIGIPSVSDPNPIIGAEIFVTLSFQDGDGDFGLTAEDIIPPYQEKVGNTGETNYFHHNLHMTVKKRSNGLEEQVMLIDQETKITTPYVVRGRVDFPLYEGQPTEGEIRYRASFLFVNTANVNLFDTLVFEATIIDRALNISNTVTTPPIVMGDY